MRHRASRPMLDLLHQVPRVAARALGALARLSPARFVVSLAVMLGVGTGAFVAVASVGDGASDASGEEAALGPRTGSTTARSAERPELSDPTAPQVVPSAVPGSPSGTSAASPRPTGKDGSPTPSPEATTALPSTPDLPGPDSAGPSDPVSSSALPTRQPDDPAPATTLSDRYPDGESAVFTFVADEPASFACSLDGAAYEPCRSPTLYSDLEPGPHTFSVRAVDAAGNVDPTPAQVEWHANRGSAAESR